MKCEYCGKELPKIINSRREICSCEKSNKEWILSLRIQDLKKQLTQANKELSDLKKKK